jgi:hypothetical protein
VTELPLEAHARRRGPPRQSSYHRLPFLARGLGPGGRRRRLLARSSGRGSRTPPRTSCRKYPGPLHLGPQRASDRRPSRRPLWTEAVAQTCLRKPAPHSLWRPWTALRGQRPSRPCCDRAMTFALFHPTLRTAQMRPPKVCATASTSSRRTKPVVVTTAIGLKAAAHPAAAIRSPMSSSPPSSLLRAATANPPVPSRSHRTSVAHLPALQHPCTGSPSRLPTKASLPLSIAALRFAAHSSSSPSARSPSASTVTTSARSRVVATTTTQAGARRPESGWGPGRRRSGSQGM